MPIIIAIKNWGAAIILAALVLISSAEARADAPAKGRRVVVVVAGNLSIRDLAEPNRKYLRRLLDNGSPGLMNVRTGRPSRDVEPTFDAAMEAECLSIGAGTMAVGGAEVRRAAGARALIDLIPVSSLYACRTGEPAPASAILHTEIPKIARTNAGAAYRAKPGTLGSALHEAGLLTAVVGNADLPKDIHREVVALAMDKKGIVDLGDVDSTDLNIPDAEAPYGLRANSKAILKVFDRVHTRAGLTVINFADTFRADTYSELCTDDRAVLLRYQAVVRLEDFLRELMPRLDPQKDLFILLTPNSRTFSDLDEERLTPVLMIGPGFGGGIITSPSTRTDGVITLNDIAPSILNHLGLEIPAEMVGRPVERVDVAHPLDYLLQLNLQASRQAQRQPAMRGGSVVQSVVVVLVTLALVLPAAPAVRRPAKWITLIPAVLPLVMLYLPLIYSGGLVGAVIWLIALTAAVIAFCRFAIRSLTVSFMALCGIVVVSLAIDLLRGAPLIGTSIGGYSIIEGARYYGIGNELMGTMLGAALAGVGLFLSGSYTGERFAGAIAALVLVLVFIFIGFPGLGANAGGAIAAAPAVLMALLVRRGWRPSARGLTLLAVLSLLLVIALLGMDTLRGTSSQSHVGRAAEMATDGGGSALLLIIQRKLALNFMLLSTSLWSRLLGLSLVGSAVLLWWGRRKFGPRLLTREQNAAAIGCVVGVLGAFMFNDSGVLAAATCAVFLWMMLAVRAFGCLRQEIKTGGP